MAFRPLSKFALMLTCACEKQDAHRLGDFTIVEGDLARVSAFGGKPTPGTMGQTQVVTVSPMVGPSAPDSATVKGEWQTDTPDTGEESDSANPDQLLVYCTGYYMQDGEREETAQRWLIGAAAAIRWAVWSATELDIGEVRPCTELLDAIGEGDMATQEDWANWVHEQVRYSTDHILDDFDTGGNEQPPDFGKKGMKYRPAPKTTPPTAANTTIGSEPSSSSITNLEMRFEQASIFWPLLKTESEEARTIKEGGTPSVGTPQSAMNDAMKSIMSSSDFDNEDIGSWEEEHSFRVPTAEGAGCLLAALSTMMAFGTPTLAHRSDLGDETWSDQPNVLITGLEMESSADLTELWRCAGDPANPDAEDCTVEDSNSMKIWLDLNIINIVYIDLTEDMSLSDTRMDKAKKDSNIKRWIDYTQRPCIIDPVIEQSDNNSNFTKNINRSRVWTMPGPRDAPSAK